MQYRARAFVRWISIALLLTVTACDSGGDMEPIEEVPPFEIVGDVSVAIDVTADRHPISSFIYGSNQHFPDLTWTVRRLGGNRLTGYNWENNYSHAGSDYQHSSDRFLIDNGGFPAAEGSIPGRVVTHFHEQSLAMGAASIVTLQMAGYVSRDPNGTVPPAETAPSIRWARVEPRKDAAFSESPDLTDAVVYMDEMVHHLVQAFGDAGGANGIRWYSLDNEPALWPHTHPRIHPDPTGAAELVERSIALAAAVKDVDPQAAILGPALYGMAAYENLQGAPDWPQVRSGYDWYVDYYLDRMHQAEATHGRRLLDVLDVHWYPEARGDSRVTDPGATTPADVEARLQAPRTLWDSTYVENSWIGEFRRQYIPILPRLQHAIDQYYPGTPLAITEYDYGGGGHWSGGLAQADVLGAYGRAGVFIATIWGMDEGDAYQAAAFNLYQNFDGSGGTFGDVSVRAVTGDRDQTSVYAAEDEDTGNLHIILINKNGEGGLRATIEVEADRTYRSANVWSFDATTSRVRRTASIGDVDGNAFVYDVPPRTAAHLLVR